MRRGYTPDSLSAIRPCHRYVSTIPHLSRYRNRFGGNGDYHLQSKEGYWDRATQSWKKSPDNSPCIDKGDPADDYSLEPMPSGRAINLGAYGNTPEASKTQPRNTLILIR